MGAPRVTPVDISGGASTVENDELTTGAASVAKAYAGGFTPDTRSPAGRSSGPTLLEVYESWRARQAAADEVLKEDSSGEDEVLALRKSRKRFRKHLTEGEHPARASAKAFEHYRRNGGRSGFAVWKRGVAAE